MKEAALQLFCAGFLLAYHEVTFPKSLRFWFDIFDLDGDGYLRSAPLPQRGKRSLLKAHDLLLDASLAWLQASYTAFTLAFAFLHPCMHACVSCVYRAWAQEQMGCVVR